MVCLTKSVQRVRLVKSCNVTLRVRKFVLRQRPRLVHPMSFQRSLLEDIRRTAAARIDNNIL